MAEEARNLYWVQVSLSSLKNSPKGQDQRSKGDTAEQARKDRWTLARTAMMQDIQENPECASPVIQAAFSFSISCDLPTYPPHTHTHRKTPLFMGGSSSLQTLIRVFPVQLPAVFYAMCTLTTPLLPCRAFLLQEPQTWRAVSEKAKGTR